MGYGEGVGGWYAGGRGIQTVVSARNASLPLPALLKSSLARRAVALFEESPTSPLPPNLLDV